MDFTPLRGKIIDAIADHTGGTSFNKLADKLRGDLSRIVLSKEIKKMSAQGILRISRDPKHKQRKIIAVEDYIIDVLNRIEEEEHYGKIGIRAAFRIALKCITEYRKLIRSVSNPFLREYIKYRALKRLEKVLEDVAK